MAQIDEIPRCCFCDEPTPVLTKYQMKDDKLSWHYHKSCVEKENNMNMVEAMIAES